MFTAEWIDENDPKCEENGIVQEIMSRAGHWLPCVQRSFITYGIKYCEKKCSEIESKINKQSMLEVILKNRLF